LLDTLRRGQRWLTALFIAAIGLVFAAFIGLGGPLRRGGSPGAVVELDDQQVGLFEFERVRAMQEQQFRDALGDQFDSKAASSLLDTQALRLLVDQVVLAHTAEELGMRVGKEEIQRTVRNIPGFRDESGRFDQEGFLKTVEYEYGSQRNFLEVLRRDLLRRKLARLLYSQAEVSDAEARDAALYSLEQVRIAFVAIPTDALPAGAEVSEEDVADYAAGHEEELRQRYQERAAEFREPERVHVRHILFQVPAEFSEEEEAAARKRAEDALARIRGGASFEDVAMEVSEDPVSKPKGGDLGFVARGELSPALEEVAFSLEPGTVSDPVRGEKGFHIVRVDERRPAGTKPFEEVRDQLAREALTTERASARARDLADRLSKAVEEGASLEEAARGEKLTLERTAFLHRRPDGFVPGLGSAPQLLAAAFGLRLEHASSPRVFQVGEKLVLVQLLERKEPDEEALAKATAEQKKSLLEQKRNMFVQQWIDREREMLLESKRLVVNADLIAANR
jgi:peptidyl-prolyl cis-trans isomerase D